LHVLLGGEELDEGFFVLHGLTGVLFEDCFCEFVLDGGVVEAMADDALADAAVVAYGAT
jgi:hypothetical protein